ncbi:MAG: electron transfer flavoprotein beta subunit/FixA family protein, partial [Candidatus Marinimicrobia bacterium]|nr:electron transfer flavoprotein beta subunit/FixA family protein [Candidatus Neomarinimicrobiota bacterium]
GKITVKRKIEGGYEVLESTIPVLITVIKDAAVPRPFSAKRAMACKGAKSLLDLERMVEANSLLNIDDLKAEYESAKLYINTLTTDDLDVEVERCGLAGSPTKVHKIESVVLAGGDHELVEPTGEGIGTLIDNLMKDHIFG